MYICSNSESVSMSPASAPTADAAPAAGPGDRPELPDLPSPWRRGRNVPDVYRGGNGSVGVQAQQIIGKVHAHAARHREAQAMTPWRCFRRGQSLLTDEWTYWECTWEWNRSLCPYEVWGNDKYLWQCWCHLHEPLAPPQGLTQPHEEDEDAILATDLLVFCEQFQAKTQLAQQAAEGGGARTWVRA